MNLAQTLGFQVAKKDSAFGKMITKAVEGTNRLQSGFKIAIEEIEKNTKNIKMLTLIPLNKIDLLDVLPGDEKERKVSGRYKPSEDRVTLRQPFVMRLLVVQLIKHEIGHHLADNFLNPKNHDSHGHLLTPKGNNIYVKYELVDDCYAQIEDEFNKERKSVEKKAGVKIEDNIDKNFEKLYRVGTDAPSLYAVRNIDEWIAEAFVMAWTPSEEQDKFRKKFPKTWDAIQAVLTGRVLDRIDK